MNIDRRNFLKATGLTFSGAFLSACGTTNNNLTPPIGTDGVLPNGYQFFVLKNSAHALPDGNQMVNLRLDAAIDNNGRVVYGAVNQQKQIGLYTLQLEFSGATPQVTKETRILRTEEILDGRKVVEITAHDINSQGELAVVVMVDTETKRQTTDDQGNFDGGTTPIRMQAIYKSTANGLTRVLHEHQTNNDGHEFAGMFGDLSLHGKNLVFVANYYHTTKQGFKEVRQGVFQLSGNNGTEASLVVSSGTPLAANSSAALISQFGLICLHDNGQLVMQTTLTPATEMSAAFVQGASQTAVLRGNLNTIGTASARTGTPNNLRVETSSISSGLRTSNARVSGLTYFAPRCGANNQVAHVVINNADHALVLNNQVLLKTGDRSPTGQIVKAIATPHLATDGISFFLVSTGAGIELVVSNGRQNRTILRNKDRLANHNSPVGDFIGIGYTAMHTDDTGRLVFVVEHQDKSQSVVIGIPL